MTIKQLRALLAQWPDEAKVELSVRQPDEYDEDGKTIKSFEEYFWVEIVDVEQPALAPPGQLPYSNDHCLIYGGDVTMV